MFDKLKFSKILSDINDTYDTMTDFAQKSGVNRTYLSQYINQKLDNPPTPKILKKIADASKGLVAYSNLMEVCGYLTNIKRRSYEKILDYFGVVTFDNSIVNSDLFKDIKENKINYNEILILVNILKEYSYIIDNSKKNTDLISYVNALNFKVPEKIHSLIQKYSSSLVYLYNRFNFEDNADDVISTFCLLADIKKEGQFHMCPVYGQISAGQPNWAEECLEGYLPIDPNLMNIINPEEYFFLRVNGESMNKVVRNGAFALIHKQEEVENGEIAVVLVNGFEATLKKFSKQGDLIILEPMSNDPSFNTQVYDKNTEIKILGKYAGKFEINK